MLNHCRCGTAVSNFDRDELACASISADGLPFHHGISPLVTGGWSAKTHEHRMRFAIALKSARDRSDRASICA